MNRWRKNGTLVKVFERLQRKQLLSVTITAISLDSICIRGHPDGMGALKAGPQSIGTSRGGRTTRRHLVSASAECPLIWRLPPGMYTPQGRKLLEALGPTPAPCSILMDRAYAGNETQLLCRRLGHEPVAPLHPLRRNP